MAVLIVLFICKTDKQKREDMARRFSKAFINGGRRLSTMFIAERRVAPTPELVNQYNNDRNIYRSVPIIFEANEDKVNNFKNGSDIEVVNKSTKRSKDNLSVTKCESTENI